MRDVRLMRLDRRLELRRWPTSRSAFCVGQEVEALLQLLRLLDRGQVDLAHALDQPAQLARALLLLAAEQRAQVVVVHDVVQLDVAVAIADLLLQRRPPQHHLLAAHLQARQRLGQPRDLGARRAQLRPRAPRAAPGAPPARPAARRGRAPAPRPPPATALPRRAAGRRLARSVAARVLRRPPASPRGAPRASPRRRDRRAAAPASARAFCRRSSACVATTFSVVSSPTATSTSVAQRRASARAARPRAPRPPSAARTSPSRPATASTSRSSFSSVARAELRALAGQLLAPRLAVAALLDHAIEVLLHARTATSRPCAAPSPTSSSARDRSAADCLRSIWRASALSRSASRRAITCSSSRISRFCSSTPVSADSREPPVTTPCGSMTSPSSVTMVLVGVGLAPQRQRALQVLDDQHVAEQVRGDLVVLPVVADQLQHRPAHAVALRPGGRDRVAVDGGDEGRAPSDVGAAPTPAVAS